MAGARRPVRLVQSVQPLILLDGHHHDDRPIVLGDCHRRQPFPRMTSSATLITVEALGASVRWWKFPSFSDGVTVFPWIAFARVDSPEQTMRLGMRAGRLAKACLVVLPFLFASLPAQAATPKQLYGKSVVIRWTETRVQRLVGQDNFRTFSIGIELSVYISTAGRVFTRLQATSGRGTGSKDEVAGQQANRRIPSFSGHSMQIMQSFSGTGLARRTSVNFDDAFTSCAAEVILAKQNGEASGYMKGVVDGQMQEIRSATTSGTSCSVRDSNVFQ